MQLFLIMASVGLNVYLAYKVFHVSPDFDETMVSIKRIMGLEREVFELSQHNTSLTLEMMKADDAHSVGMEKLAGGFQGITIALREKVESLEKVISSVKVNGVENAMSNLRDENISLKSEISLLEKETISWSEKYGAYSDLVIKEVPVVIVPQEAPALELVA